MKNKISFILAFVATTLFIQAQDTSAPAAGPAFTRGPAARLTPAQRTERQQFIQAAILDLQARRDNGTINDNERAWLDRMEQSRDQRANAVRRGNGLGTGFGPRNGTGPRAQMGTCPLVNNGVVSAAPAQGGRGPAYGMGWGGRGRGQGAGFGPRNGTGPRAQMGTCPMVDNGVVAVAPAQGGRGPGYGMGWGGRGRGQGAGFGPRNGTGPRAQMGTCPLVIPPTK